MRAVKGCLWRSSAVREQLYHENRSQAAWRETPNAAPMSAQLTPLRRNVSTWVWSTLRVASTVALAGRSAPRSCSSVIPSQPANVWGVASKIRLQVLFGKATVSFDLIQA